MNRGDQPNSQQLFYLPLSISVSHFLYYFFVLPLPTLIISDFALCQINKGPTGPHFASSVPPFVTFKPPLGQCWTSIKVPVAESRVVTAPQWPQDQEGVGPGLGPGPDLGTGCWWAQSWGATPGSWPRRVSGAMRKRQSWLHPLAGPLLS